MAESLHPGESQQVAASLAQEYNLRSAAELAAFALRTRTPVAIEMLARSATAGKYGFEELVAARGRAVDLVSDSDLPWFRHLARVVAWLPNCDDGVALEWFAGTLSRPLAGFEEVNADTAAQLMLRHAEFGQVSEVLARLPVSTAVAWGVGTDLLNPVLGHASDEDRWLDAFNSLLVAAGVEGVTLDASGPSTFDRLDVEVPPVGGSGELVTVIIPAYRPDEGLTTAVRSILRQTWQELEVLVVDDASPPEYQTAFDVVEAMDDRVRVVRQPRNRGTYPARNLGLTQARGTYVTFQDADDWSHPRRLEYQVRPLSADHRVLASRSDAVRAYPDLTVTYVGYPPTRSNASSLLFRREEVLARLGRFDDIRKSADMEFPRRLEALRPGSVVDLQGPPLAVTQLRHGSLSRSDALPGWTRWNRMAYTHSYRHWHGAIRKGRAVGWLGPDTPRPFPIPDGSFAPERDERAIPTFDVIVLGDWRPGMEDAGAWIGSIRTFARLGLRVGVVQVETPRNLTSRRQPLRTSIQELINDGSIALVHLSQGVRTHGLIVADPMTLHFIPAAEVDVVAGSVVIAARSEVLGATSAHRHAVQLFGRDARWIANVAHVRDELREAGAQIVGSETVIAAAAHATHAKRVGSLGRLRLGAIPPRPLHSSDERAALTAALPDDDEFDIRLWGDRRGLRRACNRRFPPNWTVYGIDDVTESEYLGQIDALLHPWPVRDHATEHMILTAQAAGRPVVLLPELRDRFGEATVYSRPEEMTAAAREVLDDSRRHRDLVARATELVLERQRAFRAVWTRLIPGLEWPGDGTNPLERPL